jgi:LEA14-like dessication related protein
MSTVDVVVEVENYNSGTAVLDKIQYDIHFGHEDKWIWLGQGEKSELEIEAEDVTSFMVTTNIENQQQLSLMMDAIFGTEPTEIKVDGNAFFKMDSDTVDVDFDKIDIDPYNPLLEDEELDGDAVKVEDTESKEDIGNDRQ